MCYTGRCEFENHMGECTISNYEKFKEKYSYTSCFVGGYIQLYTMWRGRSIVQYSSGRN